jgi:hypothetical protein
MATRDHLARRTARGTEALLKAHVQNNKDPQCRDLKLGQRAAARIRRENPREPFPCIALDAQ